MKVLMVPLIVMGAVAGELTDEPNEAQMRGAFEQTLTKQVRNTIAFVTESGGPQAADAIRLNRTDRFEVRTFQKHLCARTVEQRAYRCEFSVDIDVLNGPLQRSLAGRFLSGPQGLMFAQEEAETPLPVVATVL
jgi:hypothetical protein